MEKNNISKPSRIFKWSLIIGIVIVLNLFYNYTLSLVFSTPDFNHFCPQKQVNIPPDSQDKCVAEGGAWTQYPVDTKLGVQATVINPSPAVGYCDQNYTCQIKFDDASKSYDRNIFISLISLGIVTFALGLVFINYEVIAIALSIGAVLDFIIASVRYWYRADDLIKVFILGVALAILIWIAVKKFNIKKEEDEAKK